jgi:hypothetical protein
MYRGGPEDLDTLYPEDLSGALGRLETLKEDASTLRRGRRRLSNRDLARLAQMETEISSLEKRLAMHTRRVRGAHLALAEALGRGWKEYLLGLGSLILFLERTGQAMVSRRRMAADPGSSSKPIVKGLCDALWLEMENARELASKITPPEDLDGEPALSTKPLLIYLTRPARRQRLLELSQNIIDSLETARTSALDLLLATEDRLREMAAGSPEAIRALQAMPRGRTPDIPELRDPKEGAGSPYVPPEHRVRPDSGEGGGADLNGNGTDGPGEGDAPWGGTGPAGDPGDQGPDCPGAPGSPDGPEAPDSGTPAAEGRSGPEGSSTGDAGPAGPLPHPGEPAPGPHEVTHTPRDVPEALRRLADSVPVGPGDPGGIPDAPQAGWAPAPVKAEAVEEPAPPSPARTPMRTLLLVSVGLALALAATCAKRELFPVRQETSVYVYNGLGTALTVTVAGDRAFLAPGDRLKKSVAPGSEFRIEAVTEQGAHVESLFAGAPRDGSSLVYSVAGAAPFVEWTAAYGPGPDRAASERVLGALRIFASRADYVLTMPPGTLKLEGGRGTRLSLNPLSGAHPEMILGMVSPQAGKRLVRTHARWEAPDQPFLPLWLSLAVAQDRESARLLLMERRRERPGDIWTLRELLLALAHEERELLCSEIRGDARSYPDDPGLAYLEALCVSDPFLRAGMLPVLAERFPDYAFVTRALGMEAFAEGDTAKALELLRKAFAEDPRVMLSDIDLLARLSRLEGLTQAEILAAIGPWSPATRRLAEAEMSELPDDSVPPRAGSSGGAEGTGSPEGSAESEETGKPEGTGGSEGDGKPEGAGGLEGTGGSEETGGSEGAGGSEAAGTSEATPGSEGAGTSEEDGGPEGSGSPERAGGPEGSGETGKPEDSEGPEESAGSEIPASSNDPGTPVPDVQDPELALRLLHQGRPEEALNASPEPLRREMLLWAAASDGAGPDLVREWAETFAPAWLSPATVWCDWALSVREGEDRSRSEAFIEAAAPDPETSRRAIWHILERDWEGLKNAARGHDPRFQGQLALAAVIVWGEDAPKEARHMAKSYLFIGERPYLK